MACYNCGKEGKAKKNFNSSIIIKDNTYSDEENKKTISEFCEKLILFDDFYDFKTNDEIFNLQKKYEKEELNKFFLSNKLRIEQQISQAINSGENLFYFNIINNELKRIISGVINYQNGMNFYFEEIKKKLNELENKEQYDFKHMNIILLGKSYEQKLQFIKRILQMNDNNDIFNPNYKGNFELYKNNKINFFQFLILKLQTIPNSSIQQIVVNYIKEQYEKNNINNFVHCILYYINKCEITQDEMQLLINLRIFSQNSIPIIIVYSTSSIINNFNFNHLCNFLNSYQFEHIQINDNNNFNNYNYLILKIIEKYKSSLICSNYNANISLNDEITNYIFSSIKKENIDVSKKTLSIILKNFVNEYKAVKTNDKFVQYIIEIFGLNIKYFLHNKMTKESINKIENEKILMIPLNNYINFYEQNKKYLIEPTIESYALHFITYQSDIQTNENKNMDNKNLRNLESIKMNIRKYLYDNYIYLFQKSYIKNVIYEKYGFFCEIFMQELNNLIIQVMSNYNNIKPLFNEFFMNKYIKFEDKVKKHFNINIHSQNSNNFIQNQNKNLDDTLSKMSGTILNNENINNINSYNSNNFVNNYTQTLNLPSKTEVEGFNNGINNNINMGIDMNAPNNQLYPEI